MTDQNVKTIVEKILQEAFLEAFGQPHSDFSLGYPPDIKMGDFTLACFMLAKKLNISPQEVAQKMKEKISAGDYIAKAEFQGPYLNIWLKPEKLFETAIQKVAKGKKKYGNSEKGKGSRVMIEYLGPNTNKPLHLGHARNGALGMALARILESQNYEVQKVLLVNDRGIHICKSMLAWKKWGNDRTPEGEGEKGDHFVGKYYVMYNTELEKNPHLDEEIREMLRLWEAKDKKTWKLWEKMNSWVYEGFQETYAKLGLEFDATYYESGTYELGKSIVGLGLDKGIFKKDTNGSLYFPLPEDKFGKDKDGNIKKVTLLRPDGTSLYITQDLGLAVQRSNDYQFNRMIYVVGKEQAFHFHCLFEVLRAMNYSWARDLEHLPYGMVNLPDGKMKSREGKVVDTDDLIADMTRLAWEEVKKRDLDNNLGKEEIRRRAEKIGIGAIKFNLLQYGAMQDIFFDPEDSLSFEGVTGPYCQYAYARIQSIFRKAEAQDIDEGMVDYSVLGSDDERMLIQKIIQYPDILVKAAENLNPAVVANHVYETAKTFNQFYATHKVIDKNNEIISATRLKLISAVAAVIQNGLNILGIETLDQM